LRTDGLASTCTILRAIVAPVGTCLTLDTVPPAPAPSSAMTSRSSGRTSIWNSSPSSSDASWSVMLDRLLADDGSEGDDDEAESDCSESVDPLASEAVDRRLSPPSTVAAGLREAALSLTPRMLRWASEQIE